MRMIGFFLLMSLAACGRAQTIDTVAECDPDAVEGETCRGTWVCPPVALEGSTATHYTEFRCDDGEVRLRYWSEPSWEPSDAALDAGPTDAAVGEDAFTDVPDAGRDAERTEPTGVGCGEGVCTVGTEACRATCVFGASPSPVCVDAPEGWEIGECPSDEETFPIVVARCDGPEDCGAGEHCGILLGSLGNYPQCLPCDDAAECVPPGGHTLCHTFADCPTWASTCRPDVELLGGFYGTCAD